MAKKHNFAPHAMEFLALTGKRIFIELVNWERPRVRKPRGGLTFRSDVQGRMKKAFRP
jgi:hypothetical protein